MKDVMKMTMNTTVRKVTAVAAAAAMLIAVPSVSADAAKKVSLSSKKLEVKVGSSEKLKLKNSSKKATWTIVSGKKYVSLKNKKKKSVTVVGKKAGKAKVQAKVGKKKYTCTVTVKAKKSKKNKATAAPKNTPTPTPPASGGEGGTPSTEAPAETPAPTATATATAVPSATPTATPTITPDAGTGGSSTGSTPSGGVSSDAEWITNDNDMKTLDIVFEDPTLTYRADYSQIRLTQGDWNTVKDAVPDVSKCKFTVLLFGEKTTASAGDISWSSEPYYSNSTDKGYYRFTLYAEKDGKTYKAERFILADENESDYVSVTQIKQGETVFETEMDKLEYGYDVLLKVEEGKTIKDVIPDITKTTICLSYRGKQYEVTPKKKSRWDKWDKEYACYYAFEMQTDTGVQEKSGYFTLKKFDPERKMALYQYKLSGSQRVYDRQYYYSSDPEAIEYAQYDLAGTGKSSLKECCANPEKEFEFVCCYGNKLYDNAKMSNVEWHDGTYYSTQEKAEDGPGTDAGYYSFTLSIEVDGKTVSQEFALTEPYNPRYCKLSGVLTDASGEPVNESIELKFTGKQGEFSYNNRTASTNSNGEYSIWLPYGEWTWKTSADDESETFTLDSETQTKNIQSKGYLLTGFAYNNGEPFNDYIDIYVYQKEERVASTWCYRTHPYSVLLAPGTYRLETQYNEGEQEITIADRQTMDFNLSLCKVSGTLFRNGTNTIKRNKYFYIFRKESEEFIGSAGRIWTKRKGHYETYLLANTTYDIVDQAKNVVKTLELKDTDVENLNITLNYYNIRGTVTTASGEPVAKKKLKFVLKDEQDKTVQEFYDRTSVEGKYFVKLTKGTWHVIDRETKEEIGTVTVTDNEDPQDIIMK